jgi:hypothetical protein
MIIHFKVCDDKGCCIDDVTNQPRDITQNHNYTQGIDITTSTLTQTPIEEPTEKITDPPPEASTEKITDPPPEASTEKITDPPPEASTEKITDPPPEASTEKITDPPPEASTEKITDPPPEASTEKITDSPPEASTEKITDPPPDASTEKITDPPPEASTEKITETATEISTQTTETFSETPSEIPIENLTRTEVPITTYNITDPITTTTHYQFSCTTFGNFSDKRSKHSYFSCDYEYVIHECREGDVFDETSEKCITELEPDWKQYISCEKEGFFRNPYKCHKFYRCFTLGNGPTLRLEFFNCSVNDVWDNLTQTCIPKLIYGECHDLPLTKSTDSLINSTESELIRTESETTSTETTNITTSLESRMTKTQTFSTTPNVEINEIENNIEFEVLYRKYIKCSGEGKFRNPFDCHKYYQCYSDSEEISFFVCKNNLVFDKTNRECVNSDETEECINKQLPDSNSILHTLSY